MVIDEEKQEIVFASGRRLYVFNGTIGLDEDLYATYGSDGGLGGADDFSKEEAHEIADYMLNLWTKFKESIK